MSEELALEHEMITRQILTVNPGIDRMVAGLRAMRVLLQCEREKCCSINLIKTGVSQ